MPNRHLVDATPNEPPSHEDVQQLIESERGLGTQGIVRRWQAADSDKAVLISDAGGVKISRDNGATAPRQVIVDGTTAGGALAGTLPAPGFAAAPTFAGPVTINGALGVTGLTTLGSATVGGTLGVTGLTALGSATVGGTLGVTGLTTLGSATVGGTLGVTGLTTLGNTTINGALGVTGLATVGSLRVTGNATVGGTLGVDGVATVAALAVTISATVGAGLQVAGDLHVGGAVTLGDAPGDRVDIPGQLVVVGEAELRGDIDHDGAFIGLFGAPPSGKQTVSGSRAGNAALGNLLSALAAYGLITNSTSA